MLDTTGIKYTPEMEEWLKKNIGAATTPNYERILTHNFLRVFWKEIGDQGIMGIIPEELCSEARKL